MQGFGRQQSDGDLIDLIYAALLGESSWQFFVDCLSQQMPDGITMLFFHDATRASGSIGLSAGLDDCTIAAYNKHYSSTNPWMPRASMRKIGVGVVADQMLPGEELVATEFFNDFLRPNALRSAVGVTIDREAGCSFLLSTMTSQADPELNRPFADQLTRLAPHLRRASNYYRNGSSSRSASELGASLFDAMDIGLVIVGDDARIKAISAAGQAMLDASSPLCVAPLGRLTCRCEETQSSLDAMLERDYGGPKVISRLAHGIKLTLVRVAKDHISLYFEGPTVIILMERPGTPRGFDPSYFALAYGLSKAETRALAGIIHGKSVRQIAEDASLSRETIRSQLKSLYAKTGASSQSDLVRWVYSLTDTGDEPGGEQGTKGHGGPQNSFCG